MNLLIPLMRREWLQHRFGWTMLAMVPLALALLLFTFGQVELSDVDTLPPDALAVLAAMVTIAGSTLIIFLTLWVTSLIIVSGLPRRDHGDRSIEFWLSLPISHTQSLGVPLLVHLILVPAAALVVGLLGGYALSLAVVSRVVGFGAWVTLPWLDLLFGTLMLWLRLLAGLPLATLWLAPLILLMLLSTALFRRWGLPILAVAFGLGSLACKHLFGQTLLPELLGRLGENAGRALVAGSGRGFSFSSDEDPMLALHKLPSWVLHDLGAALAGLASPLLAGGLVFAAACFAALVYWRQRGAGAV